ncbi:mitochondrial substrate carrier family protein B-like [Zophobas morio]|uniref:mitochondrial substrate carrier family protein B-like n=1 Tax=Zophobas morio TaxID=2755281 RepID=UPI0030830606
MLYNRTIVKGEYSSVFSCLSAIYKLEGFEGFFKGNGANVIRILPCTAVQFASYEQFKRIFCENEYESKAYFSLLAGVFAGVTSATLTYPLDLIRTRLSVQRQSGQTYKGIIHCGRTIIAEEGGVLSTALFRGLAPTLLGISPYVALNFSVYESLKNLFQSYYCVAGSDALPVPIRLLCGAAAGAVAQTVAYPLDLVRRRMQVRGIFCDLPFEYKGTLNAVLTIAREEGLAGLYRGLVPNYYKVVPSISVSYIVYEFCLKHLF